MIVCIPHAKVGYRQAIHSEKARSPARRSGFFVGGRLPESSCNVRAARDVDAKLKNLETCHWADCSPSRQQRALPYGRLGKSPDVGNGGVKLRLHLERVGPRDDGEGDPPERRGRARLLQKAPHVSRRFSSLE